MWSVLSTFALGLALTTSPQQGPGAPSVDPRVGEARSGAAASMLPTEPLQSEGTIASGLPRRAPEPRTMRGYWPVFAAFSITWIGIVAYLLLIGRRFRRIAAMVDDLNAER